MAQNVDRRFSKAGALGYLLKGSYAMFAAVVAASIAITFFNMLVPEVISFAIDSVIGDKPVPAAFAGIISLFGGIDGLKANMWSLAVLVAALALLTAAFNFIRVYFNARANQTFMRRTRNTLFSHLQRLPLGWHIKHRTGDLIQRCTSDADTISNFVAGQLITLFRIIVLIVFSLVFMFMKNLKLALVASAFIPLFVGYSLAFYSRARKSFKKCDEEEGVLSAIAQENFTGVRVVRAFGREKYERDKFETQNVYYTGLWVKIEKFLALFWSSNDFLALMQGLLIIALGTVFCVNGEMTEGDLVAFVSYNTMLMGPVRQLGRIISNMSKAGVSLGRIAEILNAEEENYGQAGALSGAIEFREVGFEYEEDKPVLNNVSFTVEEGTTLGVLGGTGSGKSTLTYLLDGLYPATRGGVYIGGRNVNDIPPATLRNNIGLMLQEGYIYSRTVGENIALAADGSQADVEQAARRACVHSDISGFAAGYDTVVGERGVTLSGGQKQRVAIARTIMRKTPYLVFDDSLSAVDSETDARIRANLKENNRGATVVIISHRVATVMHADKIIVLDGGRIAEHGTSAELLEKGGLFKTIYDMQTALPEELKGEA